MQRTIKRLLSHDVRMSNVALPTYGPATGIRTKPGLVFVKGSGMRLTDAHGKEYVDFAAGIAVNVLGHSDPELADVICQQSKKISHVSNLYHTEENLRLCEKLVQLTPGFARVFLCNSGTEANEAALKFAALRAFCKDDDRSRIIAFKSSFHGRTLGALSVTYKPAIRAPFKSILHQNVDFCEFNNLDEVKEKMERDVLAIIVEPVQGEGGVNPAQPAFLEGLRGLADCYGSTLIFDEIQIGLGRGGHMWGHHAYSVKPDILTAAKPLAGGLPIGATLVSNNFYKDVPEAKWTGAHGTTFGGNPFVAQAANNVLERVSKPEFLAQVRKSGAKLVKGLTDIQARYPNKVKQIRRPLGDQALYAGVWLTAPVASKVVLAALERGVILITAGDYGDTIRICPPLIATEQDVAIALEALDYAIKTTEWPAATSAAGASYGSSTNSKIARRHTKVTTFDSVDAHRKWIENTCPLPPGFRVGADKLSFLPKELGAGAKSFPMRLSLITLEEGKATTQYAAVFTKNAFPGAPIRVGREIVQSNSPIGGILINNKVSNVHPFGGGVGDARTLSDAAAKALNLVQGAKILPASTGVIGWSLPVKEMLECIPRVVKNVSASSSAIVPAEAIMTTDRYPKARSELVKLKSGATGRITGVAKGAGMIEPNMATMLVYIMTDVSLPREVLQKALQQAVNRPGSFNRITVDSDQSTSDMCVLLSSGKLPAEAEGADVEAFSEALTRVCTDLAEDIVRNGEGTKHVIRVAVTGAPTDQLAHGVGAAVANSPLVKTAIFGNDPNVGRVIAAVGSYLGKQKSWYVAKTLATKTVVKVGGTVVFEKGEFALDSEKERVLNRMMRDAEMDYSKGDFPPHDRVVDIHIALNGGDCDTVVIGSDLSAEYVEVNGNYRS